MGQGRLHELRSQREVVAGVAAFSHTLLRPSQLPEVLARAFALFARRAAAAGAHRDPDRRDHRTADDLPITPRPLPARPGRRRDRPLPLLARAGAALLVIGRLRGCCGGRGGGAGRAAGHAVISMVNAKGILPPGHPLRGDGQGVGRPCARRCAGRPDGWQSAPSSARPRCTRVRSPSLRRPTSRSTSTLGQLVRDSRPSAGHRRCPSR